MQNLPKIALKHRVDREKFAHTQNDILQKNHELKVLFSHVAESPTMRRLERTYERSLQHVKNMAILEIGCGHGEQCLGLIQKGSRVCGIDISAKYINSAKQAAIRAGYNQEKFSFQVMDAHNLEFPEGTFNLVIGRAILHHLDIRISLKEIQRVLKPGGKAIFIEPLAANPLLKLFRVMTPSARTEDEKPLSPDELLMIEKNWITKNSYYGIISAPIAMITSFLLRSNPQNSFLTVADSIEIRINKIIRLRPYNQYVLLCLYRK